MSRPVLPPGAAAEQVAAGAARTGVLRARAESLAAQVSPASAAEVVALAERDRLVAAHEVAAAFYQEQLAAPDGEGPSRYLAGLGVPRDGVWRVGYAPDRPTGLVNELRRHGFTDVEITASGLAATGRGGQLVDRFRNRVMLAVRDHRDPEHPVVGFVGQAPPGAPADVPRVLHSPTTAIYRPNDMLFGLAEQADEHPSSVPPVVATDPLSAIVEAERSAVTAVAPCTPALTARQGAALVAAFDTAAGIVVSVRGGDEGRRAGERAYAVLAPAYLHHPSRPGPVLAARPGDLSDLPPLLNVVVTGHVEWASRFVSAAGRHGAARTVRALLADADPQTAARLGDYAARRLGLDVGELVTPAPVEPATGEVTPPAPQVLAGAATPTGPPRDRDGITPDVQSGPEPSAEPTSSGDVAEDTDEQIRSSGAEALAGVPAPQVRDVERPEQLLLDFGGAGGGADRAADPGDRRSGPARGGLPGQGGPADRGEDGRGGGDPAAADPDQPGDRRAGPRRGAELGDERAERSVGADGAGSDASVLAADGRAGGRPAPGPAGAVTPAGAESGAAVSYRPPPGPGVAVGGESRRLAANLAALRTLRAVQAEARPASGAEQEVLARWTSWGALPGIFESRPDHPNTAKYAAQREELRTLLAPEEYAAAERTTINAYYTDHAYVEAMWQAAAGLGFDGGTVLEPGCGAGIFIGTAPEGARPVGVELDPVSAAIAAALYPHAEIRAESFADTRAPAGHFDLTIGNVPFADVRLVDRRHNPGQHVIHNHFLIKSLHLTRPGGLVMAITSRYTMDSANPAARREMAELADLVAAVRLPNGAHKDTAGTQAITDLLILRRREPGQAPAGPAWEQVRPLEVDTDAEHGDQVNEYFLDHPQHVLGEMTLARGMYRDGELVVRRTGDPDAQLHVVLDGIVAQARADGLVMTERGQSAAAGPVGQLAAQGLAEGHIEALPDGTFTAVVDGRVEPHPVPATQAAELRALLGLRDTVTALLSAEAGSLDDGDELPGVTPAPGSPAALRAQLNTRYDAYLKAFGPLNRYTLRRTGRVDPETGEDKLARVNPPMGRFRQTDPHAATVLALEHFDDPTQTATKADIFTRRVILPRAPQLGADSPEDALAICLDTHGEVRLDEIARLLGVDETEARVALGDLVYEVPPGIEPSAAQAAAIEAADAAATIAAIAAASGMQETGPKPARGIPVTEVPGSLVEAAAYLSGNVRAKLAAARAASELDPRFEANVRALQKVIPRDLGPGEIEATLGAPWISAGHVQQFLRELLSDARLRVEHTGGSDWRVDGVKWGVLARSTWGTEGMSAPEIAQRLLTKTPIRVFVEVEDGKRALDTEGTAAAQAKATELEERFAAWVWEDPQRASELAGRYNEMFNAHVPRSYVGVTRSLPGIAVTFKPRPHQVEAVTRIVNEPAVGLFHEVGAGKTAVMAISAMEQRRLGLVAKPAIVVPNHMLEQFTREFLQIYPQAKLLAAGRDDMPTDRRRRFVARCATGDWDAVIMAASFFERLALSKEEQKRFLDGELEELRDRLAVAESRAAANGADPKRDRGVKRLQKALLRHEERIKAKLDKAKDPGVTFEQTGIDYLYRDELHELKNDTIASSIPDAQVDGSDRAVDFRMKLGYLRRLRGPRVVCGATATPIANSVRELYVVTRQLRPDLLEATGTTDFDSWASVFAKVVTGIEVSPTGAGFQLRARLAKYTNVPELSQMMRTYGDVRTRDDLNLPTPQLSVNAAGDRAPHIHTLDAAPELQGFIGSLDERVDDIRNRRVEPAEDNMLKVSGEARAASLDLRLIGLDQNTPGKIHVAADQIAAIWADTRDNVYLANPGDDHPVEHPTRGALQIVFCDQGTPNPEKWNVYDALAGELVERGMPREKIRYIHEADTDAKKAALFAACRSGDVAVLIGSTARMGVGTNVQNRAIALHHLDCPWRPADVTQREGRILRQGNQNPEISIHRYVVAGSFDAFSWQTVARKGTFIDQIMRGGSTREIEDVSDETLQAHQIKAIATGNPLLMDREEVAQDIARLDRAERAHHNSQTALQRQINDSQHWISLDTGRIQILDAAIARRVDTRGDRFTMIVAGHHTSKRADAGRALQHALTAAAAGITSTEQREVTGLAHLGGFDIHATIWHGKDGLLVSLRFHGVPDAAATQTVESATTGDATGLIRRLENHLSSLDATRATLTARIDDQQQEIARARQQLGQPFPRRDELAAARSRLRAIDAVINLIRDDTPAAAAAPPSVPVTIPADWMPADLRDSLSDDERAWLTTRLQHAAAGGALQHAARTTDLPEFGPAFDTAFTRALADPNSPQLTVSVMLKCDDPAWRERLYSAAAATVHQAVRATPEPPQPSPAPRLGTAAGQQTQASAEPGLPLTAAQIAAVTSQPERMVLNTLTQQILKDGPVQQAVLDDDQDAFHAAFGAALDTEVNGRAHLDGLDVWTRLRDDRAFTTGLTTMVWTNLVPALRAQLQQHPAAAPERPVGRAAAAAKAFAALGHTSPTGPAAAPISPAPALTGHRAQPNTDSEQSR